MLDGGLAAGDRGGWQPGREASPLPPPPKSDGPAPASKDKYVPPPKPDLGQGGVTLTAAEKDLFDAINAARAKNGLGAVAVHAQLMCAARKHALDVGGNGSCGHVGSDGSWPWDRAKACGFPQQQWTVNEIAAGPGFKDGADAVWGWSQSSGHWAAIVHPQAKHLGVGVHKSCFIALFDCCVAGS
jgi:uncharacterized protein YkwD